MRRGRFRSSGARSGRRIGRAAGAPEAPESRDFSQWSAQWARYRAAVGPGGVQQVELSGVVVGAERDGRGDLVVELDPTRTRENALQALLRFLAPVLALAVVVVHGAAFVVNKGRATRRLAALQPAGETRWGLRL